MLPVLFSIPPIPWFLAFGIIALLIGAAYLLYRRMMQRESFTASTLHAPDTLIEILLHRYRTVDQSLLKQCIHAGGVRIDGIPVQQNPQVNPGQLIEIDFSYKNEMKEAGADRNLLKKFYHSKLLDLFTVLGITLAFIIGITVYTSISGNHLPVHTYGICIALAFLSGILIAYYHAPLNNIPRMAIIDLALLTMLGSIIGARLFYILFYEWNDFIRPPFTLERLFSGGLVFYGGLIVAVIIGTVYIIKNKLPFFKVADVMALALPIGIFFGRLGCLCAGCCYGKPAAGIFKTLGLGMRFPLSAAAGLDPNSIPPIAFNHTGQINAAVTTVPLYPTQLIAALNGLWIFGLLLFLFHRTSRFNGQLFCLLLILYPLVRFFEESIRANETVFAEALGTLTGIHLTVSQWISIPIALVAAIIYAILYYRAKTSYQSA